MLLKTSLLVSTMLAGALAAGGASAAGAASDAAQPPPGARSAGTPGVSPPGVVPGVGAGTSTNPTGASMSGNRQEAGRTAETQKGSDNLISEIVVTAEKREQSLQQVPVAVSAFTAEKRDLIGIQSVVDQTNYTPGLTYQPSLDRLSLRGVGRLVNAHTVDSGTAIYVDGAFTTSTFEAGRDPLFVERTEILRGPQGTLYGRNAIGGAYNVISKMPTRELSGEARVTFGNYDREEVTGRLSGPITDWLRFSVGYQKILQGEGYQNNISGAPGRRFSTTDGVRDQDYFEGQLAGELGKFDFWFYYGKNQWNDSAPPGTVTNGGTLAPPEINPYFGSGQINLTPIASFGFTGGLNTRFFGPVRGNPALVTGDPYNVQTNVAFKNTLHENDVARTHLTYHFNDFDVKYIGSFTRYNYKYVNDTDQTSVTSYQIPLTPGQTCASLAAFGACSPLTVFPNVYNTYNEDEEFYSHEFNIASTWDKPLQYIAGLYYYHEKFQYPIDVFQPDQPQLKSPLNAVTMVPAAPNPTNLLLHNNSFFSVSSKAAFAQLDYKVFKNFKITGGIRYTSDEKKGVEEERVVCFALPACGLNPSILGSLIGGPGFTIPGVVTVPAVPGSVDITLAQAGTISAAQVASLATTGKATGAGQQGVIGYTYDRTTGNLRRSLRDGWNDVTGTAGVEWTPDRKTLAYFKYSRGYKAGAFNTITGSTFSASPYAKPEQADDFEVGLKKDWTRRIQTNITGFYEMYYDAQYPLSVSQATGPAVGVFYNIPRSIIQGIELESVFAPIDHLNILLTYAYLDAHISKACCVSDPNDPTATQPGARPAGPSNQGAVDSFTGQPARGQDLRGNPLPLSPKNKIALNANYTFDLGKYGTLIGSASYIWRDQQYSQIFQRAYNLTPSTDQVDLRLTYKEPNNRFEVIGYARNVTNNVNYETLSGTRYSTGVVYQNYIVQDPRTYGVQLQARF